RGGNQPVRNDRTGRVEITSQNHGFVIDPEETAIQKGVQVTHVNLNDNTVEGFRDQHKPLMCVQYHPEAAPGPHDAAYLFNDFFQMVDEYQRNR
ncbi:MAG: carbamoyl phosphate synthase small subunit, partial [Leptospiraceae bacterium]|nr:carbamoyl phosphate synthase small subunit [Leptospiraceae bacterium]